MDYGEVREKIAMITYEELWEARTCAVKQT